MPKRRYHIADGQVANRILDALNHCSFAQLAELGRKGLLDIAQFNHVMSWQALSYKGLSDYATSSGVPVIRFFYDENSVDQIQYTPYDTEVRAFLESMNAHTLRKLRDYVKAVFVIESYSITGSPSEKIHHLLKYRGDIRDAGRNDEPLFLDDYKPPFQTDLKQEVWRYAVKNRCSNRITFHSDYYADFALYLGVSLHWILSLETPLFFSSQCADEIFDYFTLMPPSMQETFLELVSVYVQDEMDRLSSIAARFRRDGK